MSVKRMYLNEEGLNRFFGSLEAQIMEIIWEHNRITIKEVQSLLDDDLSFNAVMTVMNRLIEKGHLKKTTIGKGRARQSYFEPVQSKEEFITEQTKTVTVGLINDYGNLMVNHMVDAMQQADPQLMKLLESRLNEWKKNRHDNH
ncbi:BlaI/MecI/CopY family transcriptional regulator [Paenibacillus phoenicis]|uniref:BlaI/MecI/CopY family transcriptional regulator n=1 Tax=Paenibacillus phoenicis TaxID=554117 RepID=UPI003D2AFFB8